MFNDTDHHFMGLTFIFSFLKYLFMLKNFCCCLLFSRSVASNSLWPHGLQHARLPCPSLSPGACSNSFTLSWWCHPTILSSVNPFSSWPLSQHQGLFHWVGFSHQVAKVLEVSFSISPSSEHLGLISFRIDGLISLLSRGLSIVFSSITILWHSAFLMVQLSNLYMTPLSLT